MTIPLNFLAMTMLGTYFLGIYQFYHKSLTQSDMIKNSFIIAQSSKLKNGQLVKLKYQTEYLSSLQEKKQKIYYLKDRNYLETKFENNF